MWKVFGYGGQSADTIVEPSPKHVLSHLAQSYESVAQELNTVSKFHSLQVGERNAACEQERNSVGLHGIFQVLIAVLLVMCRTSNIGEDST